jgi:hypothetical protein
VCSKEYVLLYVVFHLLTQASVFLKATPTSEVKVVEDLVEIRKLLFDWYERIVRPEYVLMSPVENGDVQMWGKYRRFFMQQCLERKTSLKKIDPESLLTMRLLTPLFFR